MSAAGLKSLLASGPIVGDRVTAAVALCEGWFEIDPKPGPFIFRAIFRDLLRQGWDDQQGVPSAEYEPFAREVVPRMDAVLGALIGGRADQVETTIGDLLSALRDLQLSQAHIVSGRTTP